MDPNEPWYFDEDPSALYEQLLVPAKFLPWAKYLVEIAAPEAGNKVLDVACGTGTVTRLVPPCVENSGLVVGLDFNAGRLDVAGSLPVPSGCPIQWKEGDAGALPFADGSFDIVFCQQGLQFFPDKRKALQEMHRVLIPNGKLIMGIWCAVDLNPGALAMANALDRYVSPEAGSVRREPFSFGDAGSIREFVTEAGFHEVTVEPTQKDVHFPSAEAFTKRYLSTRVPLNTMVAEASDEVRDAIVSDVNAALQRFESSAGLELPTTVNIVTARA